jgi:hypothetical protein
VAPEEVRGGDTRLAQVAKGGGKPIFERRAHVTNHLARGPEDDQGGDQNPSARPPW